MEVLLIDLDVVISDLPLTHLALLTGLLVALEARVRSGVVWCIQKRGGWYLGAARLVIPGGENLTQLL